MQRGDIFLWKMSRLLLANQDVSATGHVQQSKTGNKRSRSSTSVVVSKNKSIRRCTHMYVRTVCMYVCACIYICMYVHNNIYNCVYVCMYIYIYIYIYICTYVYICLYVCMLYVYMYVTLPYACDYV